MGKMGSNKPFKHTSLMAVVTPTDRPKSLCNRSYFGHLYVVTLLFGGCRGFCLRTGSDLFLFLFFTFSVNVYSALPYP